MSYQFLDAYGSVLSAAANTVGGAQQPIVQISSITGNLPSSLVGLSPINLTHIQGGQVNMVGNGAVGVNTLRVAIASDSAGPGSIIAFQGGTWASSIVGVTSVSGVGVFNVNQVGNGSVLAQIQGSVFTIAQGSVITVNQATSIAGTYTEDSPHVTNDRGVFTLAVRNDTLSSVTSADGDYSQTTVGPTGEVISANAPITKWWSTQTSVMYGVSVQALAPQGASVFTYISGIQIANDSATFSRVKITGGLGSVLAWTVAPANGGSNIIFLNPIKTGENSGVSVSVLGNPSVYFSAQGFTSKT